jgi:hypothetical protein
LVQNYATDKYSGNVFQFMESEELMAGEDSPPPENVEGLISEYVDLSHSFSIICDYVSCVSRNM